MEGEASMIRVFVAGVETVLEARQRARLLDLPAQDDARSGPSGLLPKLFYPERDSFYPGCSLTGVGCPIWRARFRYQPHRKPETAKAGVNAVAGHGKPELQPTPFKELRSNRVTTAAQITKEHIDSIIKVSTKRG